MALGGANVSSRMAGSTGDLLLKIVYFIQHCLQIYFHAFTSILCYTKHFFKNVKCYTYMYNCICVYIYLFIIWVILKYISYDDNIMKTNAEKYIRTAPR